jgi:ATP-dependent helicase/nuclease subunit A
MNYTNEQISAIMHDKGNILVSASAGSGKTFVMIRRLIRLIIEGFAEVDEILAVTFTNLAASEMKEKLTVALIEKINDFNTPPQTVAQLKKQLAIVPSASISTFHSFCNDLVKNYFYHLGLDASFKIADEVQAQILRKKAIDAVFEERYLNDGDGIKQLLSLFMRNRRDDNLKDMILELHKVTEL